MRCGNNNACPDGLSCNPQGVCASTASTMCDELPMDDAGVDDDGPPVARTTVTIDAIGIDGNGQNDVRIVFSTPDGEMITETRTPPSGRVVVENIPIGSAATIIRPVGASYNATTHTELWENAHIVSRFAAPPGSARTVTVNWTAPTTAVGLFYYVYTTCFSGEQTTTNLTLQIASTTACRRFDVIVLAKSAAMVTLFAASVADVDGIGPVNITPAMWNEVDGNEAIDANLPNIAGTAEIQLSGYRTPAYAYTTHLVKGNVPPSGDAPVLSFPSDIGATAAVATSLMAGNEFYQQLDVERLPPGTTAYESDMGTRQFPWINDVRLDIPTKTLSWPVFISSGMMYVQPSIVYARISFRRGTDSHAWHIISSGSRISSTTVMGTLVLPEIPGDNPFEPIAGDSNVSDELTYLGTTPGVENTLRGVIESHEQRLDIFGIDDLTYVHRSTAF